MKSETIKIDEVEYVRKDLVLQFIQPIDGVIDHGIQIVVLHREFVYIGRVKTDKDWCYITDASNIRLWGTSQGLSELVNGPLERTILDKAGTIRAPMSALIHLIQCKESAWNTRL